MHWLWRGAISFVITYGFLALCMYLAFDPIRFLVHDALSALLGPPANLYGFRNLGLPMLISLGVCLIPSFGAGLLLYHRLTPGTDGDTRCRQCNYILRGITEPRCPECGEPI